MRHSEKLDHLDYLSLLVSGPFFLRTQTIKGNICICINTRIEYVICTDQLKIFLFYVSADKKGISERGLNSITKPLSMPYERWHSIISHEDFVSNKISHVSLNLRAAPI